MGMDMKLYEKANQRLKDYTDFYMTYHTDGAQYLTGKYEVLTVTLLAKLAEYNKTEAERILWAVTGFLYGEDCS